MKKIQKKTEKNRKYKKKRQELWWALSTRERGQPRNWRPGLILDILKGLSLVPINWDTLRPRKRKMEAWSNDTTKKEEKRKSRKTGK